MKACIDSAWRRWLSTLLLLIAFGCTKRSTVVEPQDSVTAYVAASTKDAVQKIAEVARRDKKLNVKINADDSSKLAMQIVQDAPAQVFLSANEKWANYIAEKGYVQEKKLLLGNTLVIVTPKGNPAQIRTPEDLASAKRVALAGPTVPAGIYARQALQKCKVWDALDKSKKIVSGANVRITLAYVERGEADAGIVYATDAKISDQVDLAYTFPADTHDPIHYPLLLLKAGATSPAAHAFFDFLQSPRAKDIFAEHGFSILAKK